ncbi:MAG: hypothetical protein EHM50_07000, partial [Lysobacterales bacterium]
MSRHKGILLGLVLGSLAASGAAQESATPVGHAVTDAHATTARVLWQPSMNVFRRFEVPAERMYEFYGGVLGFKQLSTLNVGNGGGVARFQAGAQELKLTRRVGDRSYIGGGVRAATGLRLLTFFFADEAALTASFVQHGLAAPEFIDLRSEGRRTALVTDPDGQPVELVIVPGATAEQLARIEIGLTVADLERSRRFYTGQMNVPEVARLDERAAAERGEDAVVFAAGKAKVICVSPRERGSAAERWLRRHPDGVRVLALRVR